MLFIIPLNAHRQGSLKNLSGHIYSRDTSCALFYTVYILCIKPSNLRIIINFHKVTGAVKKIHFSSFIFEEATEAMSECKQETQIHNEQ